MIYCIIISTINMNGVCIYIRGFVGDKKVLNHVQIQIKIQTLVQYNCTVLYLNLIQ